MIIKKQFMMESKPITFEWIKAMVQDRDKIRLIKAIRTISNMGLAEAKKAIETHCEIPRLNKNIDPSLYIPSFDIDKTIAYFSQFLGSEKQFVVRGILGRAFLKKIR